MHGKGTRRNERTEAVESGHPRIRTLVMTHEVEVISAEGFRRAKFGGVDPQGLHTRSCSSRDGQLL
jgi:hypothetical protein